MIPLNLIFQEIKECAMKKPCSLQGLKYLFHSVRMCIPDIYEIELTSIYILELMNVSCKIIITTAGPA